MSHSERPCDHDRAVGELEELKDLQELMQKYSDSPATELVAFEVWLWDSRVGAHRQASNDLWEHWV